MPRSAPPDREGFEREALVHLDAVYRMALRLSGDPSDAEDLVQDTMLKAWRAWHRYEPGTNARAWLLTILRNTYINRYRRSRQQPVTHDVMELEPYTVFRQVQDVDPAGTFFDRIVDDEVWRAIDALPADFRDVLLLADVEDLAYADIATMLGVPVGTVKSRLFRGRQILQQRLYAFAVEAGYIKPRQGA